MFVFRERPIRAFTQKSHTAMLSSTTTSFHTSRLGSYTQLRRGTEGAGAYREDPALGRTVTRVSYLNPSLPYAYNPSTVSFTASQCALTCPERENFMVSSRSAETILKAMAASYTRLTHLGLFCEEKSLSY